MTESKEKQICGCHQHKIGGGANDRKLLYSNYIHTFNHISYNSYYSICLSYGFDYSFEQTTIKQKHISALSREMCFYNQIGNHIFVDPYFPIL